MAVYYGTPGHDRYNGSSYNDLILGGAGNDTLYGANGWDSLDGGSGDDVVDAGSGDDLMRWIQAENVGATDRYIGGSGVDTLKLEFTSQAWADAALKGQVAAYATKLALNPYDSSVTTLSLGGGTLVVSQVQKLWVVVDGKTVDLRAPTFGSGDVAGAVVEDTGSVLGDRGVFTYRDIDLYQRHAIDVSHVSRPLGGVLRAAITDSAYGDGQGSITWSYVVSNGRHVQALGEGEVVTETFSIQVRDSAGSRFVQPVTVTVTGVNDGPVVKAASASLSLLEDSASPLVTGYGRFDFGDVDRKDAHTVSVVADGANAVGGRLVAAVTNASTGDGKGQVSWSYEVSNDLLQFLNAGQSTVERFTVVVDDGHGGTASQVVSVTLTGVDDDVVDTGTVIEEVTGTQVLLEDESSSTYLATSGFIRFAEASRVGEHTVTFEPSSGTAGTLETFVVDNTNDDGLGLVLWQYFIPNDQVQSLGSGESIVETFTVTIVDKSGRPVEQELSLTVNGVNDLPTTDAVVIALNSGETAAFSLLAFDVDANDTLSFSLETDATQGAVTVNGDGSYTYVAAAGYTGGDQFTFLVSDSSGGQVSGIAAIQVGDGVTAKDVTGGFGRDLLGGSTSNDTLDGGAGSDVIAGRAGDDVIITGADGDIIVFDTPPASGIDRIVDFSVGSDAIYLSAAAGNFDQLAFGELAADAFDVLGDATAATAATRVVYDASTGTLSYDADGTGAGAAVAFALLENLPGLSAADFFVIP